MKLLITGGSGLLGSKTASIAVQKGYETYSVYNAHEATNGIPIKLDICNKREVDKAFEKVKPDAVIHAAALTNVDKCEENKELARRVNIEGTKNITNASEHHNVFLIHISTDYIFPGEEGLYKETDEPNPINYYGFTKLEAEKTVVASNMEWCIARPSVIYGATPASGKDNFALWVLNNLKNREPMRIVIDQWVSPTLNTNLTEMILEITERKLTGIYHLAGATPLNRHEFTTLIAETFQLDETFIFPARFSEMNWLAKRPRNNSLDVRKALKTLKNKPIRIREALSILREEIQG